MLIRIVLQFLLPCRRFSAFGGHHRITFRRVTVHLLPYGFEACLVRRGTRCSRNSSDARVSRHEVNPAMSDTHTCRENRPNEMFGSPYLPFVPFSTGVYFALLWRQPNLTVGQEKRLLLLLVVMNACLLLSTSVYICGHGVPSPTCVVVSAFGSAMLQLNLVSYPLDFSGTCLRILSSSWSSSFDVLKRVRDRRYTCLLLYLSSDGLPRSVQERCSWQSSPQTDSYIVS